MYTSPFSTSPLASSFLRGVQPTNILALRQSGSSLYIVSKSGGQEVTVFAYTLKNPAEPSAAAEKKGSAVITTIYANANVWCSPSGHYAVVSLCDERQLTAEIYGVSVVSKKQKLRVFKIRGIEVPITTLTFVCPHHPIWKLPSFPDESSTTAMLANEDIEGVHSPEFLFATSDNCLNVGQIVKNEAKLVRKTKVISLSKGAILHLHTIPINHSTIDAARKIGMQNYDQYSAPSADMSSAVSELPVYKTLNVLLTLVCSRGLIKAYLHTVRSLFDIVFSSRAELTRFDLADVEVLQRGPIINTVADFFYSATGSGLTYQIISQSIGSSNLLVYQYNVSFRKIFESVLRTRISALLKISYQDQDSDAGTGYTELKALLKKCDASSFVNFAIDVPRIRGFDPRDPVLVCLDDTDSGNTSSKQTTSPGALLGTVIYNYHSVIILANRLSVFNSISRSQVTMLPNPVAYNDTLLNLQGLDIARLSKLHMLLQSQFIYSGAELKHMFPTVTDTGVVDLSTVLHFYVLLSYGKLSRTGITPSSIGFASLNVQDEAGSMWFIYYALHEYDKALQYCPVESTRKIIREEYAKQCLANNKVLQGARLLSQTDLPLLDVYRDLIGIRKYEAAVLYLQEKLQKMPAHNAALARAANTIRVADLDSLTEKDGAGALLGCLGVTKEQADQANYSVARKLLIHMLIEAMILEIDARMRAVETYKVLMEKNEEGAYLAVLQAEDQVDVYKTKLKTFLTSPDYVSALDLSVLRSSLLDHGLDDIVVEFSRYKKDNRTLFTNYLLTHNYKDALYILADQDLDLFYYYSNTLLSHIPREYLSVVKKKTKHVAVLAADANGAKPGDGRDQIFALSKLTKCFVEALNKGDPEVMRELVSFFRWLLLDEEGSIEPSVNTFAFEFLAKAGEEELLSLAIDVIPMDFSVDTSVKKFNLPDITSVCRSYGFRDCEAKCLTKTGNQLDALSLSLSLHKKIPLAEICFGRKEACIVNMIKSGDLKGTLLSRSLSINDKVCSEDTCDSVSSLQVSLPNDSEVLILDAADLIDKSHRVEQKRQLLKTLVTWLISIELYDPTDSLSDRGWLTLNPSLSKTQVYIIVEAVFRQLVLLRATELMFDFPFVSLTEVMDLILSAGAPYNVVADSLHLAFKHYQNRSVDVKQSLTKCVSQIVAKKCDLEEARQRTVAHEGQKVCGVCLEYLDNSHCLASGLGIRELAMNSCNFLAHNHTVFFCGHVFHTSCLAFYLSPLSSRINKLIKECDTALHTESVKPTGLVDKLIGKLASSCPLCDAYGVEEISIDICNGAPLLLRL